MLEKFKNYLFKEKRVSEHTVTAYLKDLNDFIVFTGLEHEDQINEVSHHIVRSWIVDLVNSGVSNKSINRKLSSLRTFFKWNLKQGYVSINPMLKVKGPKVEKRIPEFLKQEELMSAESPSESGVDKITAVMVELFYQTGIRLSELVNLKQTDLQGDSVKVLGKRNKERIIPISNQLYTVLREFIEETKSINETTYIFCTGRGKKLYPKFVYRKINKYLSTVTNLSKKSPHILRHTFATHMLNNGAGLEVLKELLGHANLSATQIYTHNSFEEINKIYKQAHPRGQ